MRDVAAPNNTPKFQSPSCLQLKSLDVLDVNGQTPFFNSHMRKGRHPYFFCQRHPEMPFPSRKFTDGGPRCLSQPSPPPPHCSWETRSGAALLKSRKKGPSCLGRKVVGMTL